MSDITCLEDLYNSQDFEMFMEGHRSTFDSDRLERIEKGSKHGAEGSTHGEIIDDWREFLESAHWNDIIDDETFERIEDEIDSCENWHVDNGSIDQVIG